MNITTPSNSPPSGLKPWGDQLVEKVSVSGIFTWRCGPSPASLCDKWEIICHAFPSCLMIFCFDSVSSYFHFWSFRFLWEKDVDMIWKWPELNTQSLAVNLRWNPSKTALQTWSSIFFHTFFLQSGYGSKYSVAMANPSVVFFCAKPKDHRKTIRVTRRNDLHLMKRTRLLSPPNGVKTVIGKEPTPLLQWNGFLRFFSTLKITEPFEVLPKNVNKTNQSFNLSAFGAHDLWAPFK